jgi:WD40 repeat protein
MEAWEEATCVFCFSGHNSPVQSLALNATNTMLVAGCADGVVGVWDVPRRRPLSRLRAHAAAVTAVLAHA